MGILTSNVRANGGPTVVVEASALDLTYTLWARLMSRAPVVCVKLRWVPLNSCMKFDSCSDADEFLPRPKRPRALCGSDQVTVYGVYPTVLGFVCA